MTADEVRELFCGSCAEVVRFELLTDGYRAAAAYDEWACTICGAAILTDSYAAGEPGTTATARHHAA